MQVSESVENYLECIYMLGEKDDVHSVMIAKELGVTKASVSHATKMLKENGYIKIDTNNHITLTKKGKTIAEKMYGRHKVLSKFFVSIGVSEQTALDDACRIEHDISDETFDAILEHLNK